jgi:hypothetical protein
MVAGEELEGEASALGLAEAVHGMEIEAVVEGQCQRDPHRAPEERFSERDDVRVPMEDAEIEGRHQENDGKAAAGEEPDARHR